MQESEEHMRNLPETERLETCISTASDDQDSIALRRAGKQLINLYCALEFYFTIVARVAEWGDPHLTSYARDHCSREFSKCYVISQEEQHKILQTLDDLTLQQAHGTAQNKPIYIDEIMGYLPK